MLFLVGRVNRYRQNRGMAAVCWASKSIVQINYRVCRVLYGCIGGDSILRGVDVRQVRDRVASGNSMVFGVYCYTIYRCKQAW